MNGIYETVVGRIVGIVLACMLAACGGGGGDSSAGGGAAAGGGSGSGSTAGNLSTSVQPATYAGSSYESVVYSALNEARQAGGFGTLAQENRLDAAAAAHSAYTLMNYLTPGGYIDAVLVGQVDPATGALIAHTETAGLPGFTGILPEDRVKVAGYTGGGVGEAIAGPQVLNGDKTSAARKCVAGLLGSPGHRQILLDTRFTELGIGVTVNPTPWVSTPTIDYSNLFQSSCVLNAGMRSGAPGVAPASWIGIWPLDGATTGSTGDGHGFGYPASVNVDSAKTLRTTSFVIRRVDNGAVVPTTSTIAQTSVAANWAFAVPVAPLDASTTYQAEFVGTADGVAISKTWKFKTP